MESIYNTKVSPEFNMDSKGVYKETTHKYRVLNCHMGYIRIKESTKKEKELYYSLGNFYIRQAEIQTQDFGKEKSF